MTKNKINKNKGYGKSLLKVDYIVFFLALYFPFEEIFLKYLSFSDSVYSVLRYAGELLIYFLFIVVLIVKLIKRDIKTTPLDFPFLIFLGLTIISSIINKTSFIEMSLFLRSVFRYVFLFYIVVNLKLSEEYVKKLIVALVIIGVIQSLIGFSQLAIGGPLNNALKPRESMLSIGGYSKQQSVNSGIREKGSIYGTTGDTVSLALFLVVAFCLSLSLLYFVRKDLKKLLFMAITIFSAAIIFTFSRSTVLTVIIILATILFIKKEKKKIILVILGTLIIFSFLPTEKLVYKSNVNYKRVYRSPLSNIAQVFTGKYQRSTYKLKGRTYILSDATTDVLSNSPIFGMGPRYGSEIKFFDLRDVYWILILYEMGILGLAVFLYIFIKLWLISWNIYKNSKENYFKVLAFAYLAVIIGVFTENFFMPAIEVRTISVYFWLFAGIIVSNWIQLKKETNTISNQVI